MANFGFNFRKNVTYVADPSDTVAISTIPTTRYPSVRAIGATNYTVGYINGLVLPTANNATIEDQSRDRSLAVDARLAGVLQVANQYVLVLRFDLPSSGSYRVRLAAGDMGGSKIQHITIYDSATPIHTSATALSVASGSFADTNGTIHTAANWPTNNTYTDLVFSTTEAYLYVGAGDGVTTANNSSIAHISFENLAALAIIDSVNGDDELVAAAANTAEVTGYDDGVNPIISGTVGSLALSSVSQTGSTVAFTIDSPVNASYYPEPDAEHTLTLTDGTTPATFDAIMRFADYTSVVVASAVLGDEHYLGGWTTSEPQDGDRFVYDPLFWTVAADGSYTGATEGPSTIWLHWRASDSKIFAYQSTVSDGVIVSGGLSVTGLSVTGLSVRGLAVRGLGGAAAMAGGFPYLLPFLLS